ncbi:hypothetical protein ABIB94_004831 [Bradyrhizobium sp. JR7.2]|uniref:hypothetical protein n=1 Tax=Bradyrhizobium TaxID=374 RepID=UPI0024AEE0E4|nr:hypothetical protein [Bradyrhizobium barranii]WFT93392.1 hypothetical protein QA633_34580 [Bradyrhizobium barranii]
MTGVTLRALERQFYWLRHEIDILRRDSGLQSVAGRAGIGAGREDGRAEALASKLSFTDGSRIGAVTL